MPITLEASDLLARMKDAEIVLITWPDPDTRRPLQMMCGNANVRDPEPLELAVGSAYEAGAMQEAMRAVIEDDEPRARFMLLQMSNPGAGLH